MNEKSPGDQSARRGSNYQKNKRPDTSKRVTFALGVEGQEQADRIARVLSNYKKGGVSQSAVVRGLLRLAESIARESGDPLVKAVMQPSKDDSPVESKKRTVKESAMIWKRIRTAILES